MLVKPIAFMQQPIVTGGIPATQYIYLNGYNFYKWKGTRLGVTTSGGLAKIGLDGTLDSTFATNANPTNQSEVRFAAAFNGYIYGDARVSAANQIRKWDALTGNIIASSSVGATVWGVSTREGSNFFILTGTKALTYGGLATNGVGKIYENMTRDATFNTNLGTAGTGGSPAGFTNKGFISADRIGVAGNFTSWNGSTSYDRFVVLNYDGTRDTGFSRTGNFASGNALTAIFIDNKWIVGGTFTSYGGVTRNRIMAFNTDGSVDTAFTTNIGTAFNDVVSLIHKVSDTQVVVTGAFTTLNGVTANRIALLNTDGTIPTNIFGTGFNATAPVWVGLDNTGKYYIAGAPPVTTYQGATNTSNNFFSLNANGTINSSFATGSAMQTSVNAIAEGGGLYVM